MAGGNPKGSAQKPSSSSFAQRKSRWESGNRPSSSDQKHGGSSDSKHPKPSPIQKETLIHQQSDHRIHSPIHHSLLSDRALHPAGLLPDPSAFLQPPPVYGFHMLERRTIVLPDDSVRTYLALPHDYNDSPLQVRPLDPPRRVLHPAPNPDPEKNQRFPPGRFGGEGFMADHQDYWSSLGLDGKGGDGLMLKRKYGDEDGLRNVDRDGGRGQQQLQQQGFQRGDLMPNGFPFGGRVLPGTSSPRRGGLGEQTREEEFRPGKIMRGSGGGGGGFENMGLKSRDVDPVAMKRSYLYFAKLINENASQKKLYLEDSKKGCFHCDVCGRSSKEFSTVHELIMHTYNSDSEDLRLDHLGLHKALCVLMGWNFAKPPDKSKTYQFLPAEEAEENQDDQIFWPPTVIVHNTMTGKAKDGRNEGLGNKAMDIIFREMGFANGKSKSQYNKEGHTGITLLSFAASLPGLKDADNLEEHFLKEGRGRKAWAGVVAGGKDEKNPKLVQADEKTGDKKRVLYGYVATASDLDKLEAEVRKKVSVESRREYLSSMKPSPPLRVQH